MQWIVLAEGSDPLRRIEVLQRELDELRSDVLMAAREGRWLPQTQ
jgi:hypothetical protein